MELFLGALCITGALGFLVGLLVGTCSTMFLMAGRTIKDPEVARYNLRDALHNKAAIAWIDNEAARYAVSKGTATAPSLMAMARILQSCGKLPYSSHILGVWE